MVDDVDIVEFCGVFKNIVVVGVGFCDGFCCGDNIKVVVICLGFMEMIVFVRIFCKG